MGGQIADALAVAQRNVSDYGLADRVIAFDGSIPHQAFAPKDDKFRMSVIIRGKYRCGAFEPADEQRNS